MPFIQQDGKMFTKTGIEWLNPGQIGVYGIYNTSRWIYIGRGDIRERLLAHLGGDNACITQNAPTHYVSEVNTNAESRERELIIEHNPICNQKVG